jgi:hypothetical protein
MRDVYVARTIDLLELVDLGCAGNAAEEEKK